MDYKVFSVYDNKVGEFNRPFYGVNTADGIRAFVGSMRDQQSMLSQFPEDFCLFEIGTFDGSKGRFSDHMAPINLGLASSFMSRHQSGSESVKTASLPKEEEAC